MINGEIVIEWKKEKSTPIVLTVDEYETIRLLDKKGYSQSSNCSFGGCYKQEIYKKYAAGIKLFGGVSGDADKAVEAFINDTLDYNPDVKCSHHEHNHGGGHTCGEHGCGSHSCH